MDANVVDGPIEKLSDFLDTLPAYNNCWNQIPLLDISRQVWDAGNYYYLGIPFPTGNDIFFNQPGSGNVNQTLTGDLTVPQFSLLTSICFFSGGPEAGHPGVLPNSGFKIRVYDKGGKVDMIMKQFSIINEIASRMAGEISGLIQPNPDDPFGPYYLLTHMFVMPPGVLTVEITDLSGVVNNMIQVLFNFAVPLNAVSTNTQQLGDANV